MKPILKERKRTLVNGLIKIEQRTFKNIKVYIVDDGYNVLKQIKDDLSSYPYAFRLNSDLNDEMIEIDRIRPEMICINLPNEEDRIESDEEGVLSPMEQQIVKLGKE